MSNNIRLTVLRGALATLALAALAACGGPTGTDSQPTPQQTATPAQQAALPETPPSGAHTSTPAVEMPAMEMEEMVETPISQIETLVTPEIASTPTEAAPARASDSATQIEATLVEWDLTLSKSEVSAGKVTFTVTNAGQMRHNLMIMDSSGTVLLGRTPDFMPSQGPQTVEVELEPGTYIVLCGLPGHAERGQQSALVVK